MYAWVCVGEWRDYALSIHLLNDEGSCKYFSLNRLL